MEQSDYIIVGAGSAGCVLANRLSSDPGRTVTLIEAGGRDVNPMIHIPKGFPFLLGNPNTAWGYATKPFGPTNRVETWARGKTLGGSSSINGMVYNRGHAADWNDLVALGNAGWGWEEMLPVFRQLEDHQLGPSDMRGSGGPLHISTMTGQIDVCEEVIASGARVGMSRVDDVNGSGDPRIGYAAQTIKNGRRWSAARAFLHPVMDRSNLSVLTQRTATRLIVQGDRVVGVETVGKDGDRIEHRARKEVIISTGSLATPKLLQLSGIGPREVLTDAGVEVRVESPNVGSKMYEHRCFIIEHRLDGHAGYNPLLSRKIGQGLAGAAYLATRRGPLSRGAYDVIGFLKSDDSLDRPDGQVLMSPFSAGPGYGGRELDLERAAGMQSLLYILRPDSRGSLRITSADPGAPLEIDPQYLTSDHDREVGLKLFGRLRDMLQNGPIGDRILGETLPGPAVRSDQDVIDAALIFGHCGYHAVATCAMGPDDEDAVDGDLRVRGVDGLRVVDCSVMPTMISGNLNGPIMAMAWRAADLIRNAD